jgi:hypothetical protein
MRIRSLIVLTVLFLAVPLFAGTTRIYARYKTARQALLNGSVAQVAKAGAELGATARAEKQNAIATRADALAGARDLAAARIAFAALSDEVIKFRANGCCERPVVVYCSMEKKSWLQSSASPIGNPYLDSSMSTCGEIVKDAPQEHQH